MKYFLAIACFSAILGQEEEKKEEEKVEVTKVLPGVICS